MNIQQFNFDVDLLKVILWQYNEDEKLLALLEKKQEWYKKNQTNFWKDWYKNVFNLDTANDFGLAVWAIILDVPLFFDIAPSDENSPAFGFSENYQNFENGNFISTKTTTVNLSTDQKRLILKLRYFKLSSNCTIDNINKFLSHLFKKAYIIDRQDMNFVIYIDDNEISAESKFILENFDLIPRPAGVGMKIIYSREDLFGFGENYQNFENGVFANINNY